MNDKTAIEKARECIGQVANSPDDFLFTAKFLRENLKTLLAALDAEKPVEVKTYRINKDGIADHSNTEYILLCDIQHFAASYHAEQCKACSCNGCENEGQGMPICEMCQRNPNRSDYYKSLPGGS